MNPIDVAVRRVRGEYRVDEWGCDEDLADAAGGLAALRWSVEVTDEGLPADGPALIVFNRRFGVAEPVALALAVRQATGRRLRVVGVPDLPVLGPALRALEHDELATPQIDGRWAAFAVDAGADEMLPGHEAMVSEFVCGR